MSKKCILAPKIDFFLFCWKSLLLHVVLMKKVGDRGFPTFWPLEMSENLEESVTMLPKI